ncbi:hypothetical protein ACXA45_04400 [Neomicrococcus lactis]
MTIPPRPDRAPEVARLTRGARLRRTAVVFVAAVAVGVSVPLVYDAAAQQSAAAERSAAAAKETGPAASNPDNYLVHLLSSIDALKASGTVTDSASIAKLDSLRASLRDSAGSLLSDSALRALQNSEQPSASDEGQGQGQNQNAQQSSAAASSSLNNSTPAPTADPLELRVAIAQASQHAYREALTAEPGRALPLARLAENLRFAARDLGKKPSIGGAPAADQSALFKDPLKEFSPQGFTSEKVNAVLASLPQGRLKFPGDANATDPCAATAAADIAYRLEYAYSVAAADARGTTRELYVSRTQPLTLLGHGLEQHNDESCGPVRSGGYVLPKDFAEKSGTSIDAGLKELSAALTDLASGQDANSESRKQLLGLALQVQGMAMGA